MPEKSQKEKCCEWTHITGLIYQALNTVKGQIGDNKILNEAFDSIMVSIKSINHEFVEAFKNGKYEYLNFPPYDIEIIIGTTNSINAVNHNNVLNINDLSDNKIMLNAALDWKKLINNLIDTFLPSLEVIADHIRLPDNLYKFGALYTAINGFINSLEKIKSIIKG